MLRRLFGAEKAREDSASARSLKGPDSEDSRSENTVSQSLPDLTIGPSAQLTTDQKERKGKREEIRTERPKTSEDSLIEGSLCSDPGTGQTLQVSKDPAMMYSSIDSLLAVPRTEIKRVPHSRAFSMKKTLSSKRNIEADDLSDTSAASSPRNSRRLIVADTSNAGNLLPKQSQMTTPVKKLEENPEETSREGVLTESQPEPTSADKATKRANKKSRKQRYKTVTGSELMVPVEVQKNPEGAFQSDNEGALTRSMPGWRSASLKGTPQGKAAETSVQVLKNEGTPVRALNSAVPISKLDDYVVLVSDQLDENGDIQAVKVDVSATPLPLKLEDLASYMEATAHRGKSVTTSLNNVAILLPSSKNSSSVVASSVGQFTNMKRVCIAKGNAAFARDDAYMYSRYMFLTAGFLYVMKQKTTTTFKLKKRVAIGDLWLAPDLSRSGEVAASFIMGWPLAINYTVTFSKADQKNAWMTTLEKLMEMERLKDGKREAIIQIVIEDTDVTVKKSLVVTCEVTASQVIQKCLKELHLAEGDPDHYELCVKFKDSATSLIGHEIPLYIQLKNSPLSHRDGQQVAAHHNDSGSNVFDHFVLRPRKTTQRNGFRHRPRKARRITLTGLFGRRALPQQQQPDVLQSTPQAKLFGRSLAEVCSEESLPKPVMDLLRRLYVQGASTPGIFRKPGNQRDLQDLKARLDAGEECNMDDISIHVASSALKSFLRDLPDCVLLSNLYCKWIDVVCIHDNSKKQETTNRLVSLLPSSNLLLLRHLVCVLHHISLHSEHNQMTSGNLAICLGPTFLWPEGTVDLTSQFGSVELVARVMQMFIDDAQTILGSDSLELFHDLDDREPSIATELNFESEDSFGSHELIDNKRDLTQGTSLESLDSASFDETQSTNAVQSQVSIDSGLAVSNPLLYDDPESPTATTGNQATAFEGSRYAKRQLGVKKKLHTKSELSDISEALTVLDPEERPNSKLAGATNVRRRIHRFQVSKAHSDETTNDSAGDNAESSEDEKTFARASISSSENMGDSIIGVNSEDALSRDLDNSLELEENVNSDEVQRFMVDVVQETFRSERMERQSPAKTVIRLVSSTTRADKTSTEGTERVESLSSDWYFTGPDSQVDIRNLRSVPAREQKPRNENGLLMNTSRSQVTPSDGLSSVGSKLAPSYSLRCDRPVKGPHQLKPVKQSSLDSIAPSVVSCPEMHALQQTKKPPHDSNESSQLSPRLTSFQVLENVPSAQRSRFNSRTASGLVSSDSLSRADDRPRIRAPRERSVPPRRHVDAAVNVTDSCFRTSRGVQTDDCEMSVGPIVTPKRIAMVAVGTGQDEMDGVGNRKENPAAYKIGRRYKSDLDLASNRRSWNQDLADSYSENVRKEFMSPVEQLRSSCESDGVTGHPLRNGDSVRITAEEQQNYFPFQHQTPRLPVRKGSLPREPAGNVSECMQVFEKTRAPVIIEQRVRDRRAVTVVKIGDEKSILPSKFGSHPVHQPMSFQFPVNGTTSSDAVAGNQNLDNERGSEFISSRPVRKNLAERKSNDFQNYDNSSSAPHEYLAQKPTATPRMLPIQPRSGIGSSPLNSSTPQRNNAARQVVAPCHADSQGHVFGGHHSETPRNIDNHIYVPSSKTESAWKDNSRPDSSSRRGDGLHQRPSQHRSNASRNIDSQRHPTTQEVDSAWLCDNTGRQDETVRQVTAGPCISTSQPSFGTPRNTKTSQQTELINSSAADQTDEPSGVTWSVTQLKKMFDSSKRNTRFTPPQAAVCRKQ